MRNELILKEKTNPLILKGGLNNTFLRKSSSTITISKIALPEKNSFDDKIAWICASLGFFETIDKNKNAARIFKEIFLAGTIGQILTSTTISQRIGMSRGSTINHLNKLEKAGLIEKAGKYYFTRQKKMVGIITELEDDINHIFNRLKKTANEIDDQTTQVLNMK
jgi:predicted transcriptional regulator